MANKKAIIIIAPVVLVLLIAIYVIKQVYTPYEGQEVKFNVRKGEAFSSVNHRLSKDHIVASARIFHYYSKLNGKMDQLKAGTYLIPTGANMSAVLTILTEGVPILTKVTIPEGKNMFEIGKILEEAGITSYADFVKACRSADMIKKIKVEDAPSVEGYLFPETYKFAPNSRASEVVSAMIGLFYKKTQELEMEETYLTAHEVVTLASIVEKETGAKWERPTIAGVYLNRLKLKMRLQADPTTIYGIWETYDGNLRSKHLTQKTPYNTYKMTGLPLGPIANPSLAAIKAVLTPEEHDYIYFVSKNDGTHVFSSSYKDHQKAVDFWQKNRANRQGKSWRDLKQ